MIFIVTKMAGQNKFSLSSFGVVVESVIQDPESGMDKNQDPGSTSRIRNTAEIVD
jgi:hypothetical protein